MHKIPAACLLLVVDTDEALRLHRGWLEAAGYSVTPASSLKEVEQACHASFDMVLMTDSVDPKMKKAIGKVIRHFFPETPILQMGRTRPDIGGNCFVTSDSRDAVLRSVSKILRRDEIPPAAL
jgi:CheY-like chemotaxis protein